MIPSLSTNSGRKKSCYTPENVQLACVVASIRHYEDNGAWFSNGQVIGIFRSIRRRLRVDPEG